MKIQAEVEHFVDTIYAINDMLKTIRTSGIDDETKSVLERKAYHFVEVALDLYQNGWLSAIEEVRKINDNFYESPYLDIIL